MSTGLETFPPEEEKELGLKKEFVESIDSWLDSYYSTLRTVNAIFEYKKDDNSFIEWTNAQTSNIMDRVNKLEDIRKSVAEKGAKAKDLIPEMRQIVLDPLKLDDVPTQNI